MRVVPRMEGGACGQRGRGRAGLYIYMYIYLFIYRILAIHISILYVEWQHRFLRGESHIDCNIQRGAMKEVSGANNSID